jgi:flagellar hook-associated protein 1 FlgK
MGLGVSAMTANYAALQTTGHNIANANVSGYSRQTVQLATAQGQFTGAGYFGRGVNVTTVSRAHDGFLTSEAIGSKSVAAMDSARLAQLQGLEKVFQTGAGSLGDQVSQLFGAVSDLSSNPDDLSARQVVLARARDVAAGFRASATAMDEVQASVTDQLNSSVANVNSLARGVADLNKRIANLQGLGQPPNDLLDQRETLIASLAAEIQVTRIDASDGTASLFIGGGQTLVLGAKAAKMAVIQDPGDASRSAVALVVGGVTQTIDANGIGGGAIKGALDFQNADLIDGRALVDALAVAVRDAFNQQQGAGLDLSGHAGEPLFATGQAVGRVAFGMEVSLTDPKALAAAAPLVATTAAANTGTAAVSSLAIGAALPNPGASAAITFSDNSGNYDWTLTNAAGTLIDSGSGTWTAGQSITGVNGFSLQLSGTPRAGDVVSVAPPGASAVASNNGNALALLALQDARLVNGQTATDAWVQAATGIAVRVQSAKTAADLSGVSAEQAEQARSSQAGVNLDEEAARLIQFQQSYQAAAKILQVAQTLFDTLLQAAAA